MKRNLLPGQSISKQKVVFPNPFRPSGRKKNELIKLARTLNENENTQNEKQGLSQIGDDQ